MIAVDRRQFIRLTALTAGSFLLDACVRNIKSETAVTPAGLRTEPPTGTPTESFLPTVQGLAAETATATLPSEEAEYKEKRESLGLNREDSWPGARIVPDRLDAAGFLNLSAKTMASAYIEVRDLLQNEAAQIREIPTFQFLLNLVEADLGSGGEPAAFAHPDFSSLMRENPDLSKPRVWVASKAGQFGEVKDLQADLKDQLALVLSGTQGRLPGGAEINDLYTDLTKNLFAVRTVRNIWGMPQDMIVSLTRYLTPSGSGRANQPEVDVCTFYIPDMDRGEDYIKVGVMYKPNSTQMMPVLAISRGRPLLDEMQGVGVALIPGTELWLNLTVFDPDSRPDHSLFGFRGVPKWGDDVSGPGCFTVLLGNCGLAPTPTLPEVSASNTSMPPLEKTPIPPAKTPKPRQPTPIPTNPDIIPTSQPAPQPTSPQPTEIP